MRWICSVALVLSLGAAGFAQEPDAAAPAAPAPGKADRSAAAERAVQKWAAFSAKGADWRVSWNAKTGLPRMIYGDKTKPYAGSPSEAAQAFLEENAELVGVPAAAVAKAGPAGAAAGGKAPGEMAAQPPAVELRKAAEAEILNGTRVTFQQYCHGIPVFNAECIVCVDGAGAIWHVANSVHPDLSADVAAFEGAKGLGLWMARSEFDGNAPQVRGEPERVIYPAGTGTPALRFTCRFGDGRELWQVVLDAVTGDELRKVRLVLD